MHVVTRELEQAGQGFARVHVVIDDQDASTDRAGLSHRELASLGGCVRERQSDDELGPEVRAGATGFDTPAVRLDQPPHNREPDAEAAVSPIEPTLALHEQIEDPRQEIRRDADAGITHPKNGLVADRLDLDAISSRSRACT